MFWKLVVKLICKDIFEYVFVIFWQKVIKKRLETRRVQSNVHAFKTLFSFLNIFVEIFEKQKIKFDKLRQNGERERKSVDRCRYHLDMGTDEN